MNAFRLSAEQRTALRRAITANPQWPAYRAAHNNMTSADLTSTLCLEIAARFAIDVAAVIAAVPVADKPAPHWELQHGVVANDDDQDDDFISPSPAPLAQEKAAPVLNNDKAAQLANMLAAMMAAPAIDKAAVEAIVGDKLASIHTDIAATIARALDSVEPRVLEIKIADKPAVKIDGHRHPMFEEVLSLVAQGENVMLKGPAGCGKTHLGGMVAEALDARFSSISGSAGVSESQLTGRLLPTGDNGKFEYVKSPFVDIYENGGVFLFDEMDAFDPNCLLTINKATANGGFEVEARAASGIDPFVRKHKDARLIAATNTFGTGADAMYVGRAQLDAATLDRWYVLEMDYDKRFEATLATDKVVNFVWHLRETIAANRFRRVASTRAIQRAARGIAAGRNWATVQQDLVSGWTVEEKKKVEFSRFQ